MAPGGVHVRLIRHGARTVEGLYEGKFKRGDIVCMTAFGGGLTAGSCVLKV